MMKYKNVIVGPLKYFNIYVINRTNYMGLNTYTAHEVIKETQTTKG